MLLVFKTAPTSSIPLRPLQALLSRGDRRLTALLLLVREYGDSLGSFRRAFKELEVGGWVGGCCSKWGCDGRMSMLGR
jgi:hypothetical protein